MNKPKLRPSILLALLLSMALSSCKVGRFIYYNFADINDHKKFPARPLEKSQTPFVFPAAEKGRIPSELTVKGKTYPMEHFFADNRTVAFLVVQNDSIQYERYFNGYDKASIVPSFSMAKSVTSILIGCAIDDKLIKSVDEPVTNYIPELKENGFDKVTIEHLLQMTSAIDFNESYYNPFGDAATFYYGRNLRKVSGLVYTCARISNRT
jgi:hypothetical protein